jgi:hypothetical protein
MVARQGPHLEDRLRCDGRNKEDPEQARTVEKLRGVSGSRETLAVIPWPGFFDKEY